ncbi:GIY-YIG nuclease family protein [Bacillus proteolyticus]|uniref:GIY-YIG nuclease family protein n=1 Tax=Bacillus proteolyticus TaxID=2026192 RepID=UPI0030F3AF07
MLSEDDEHKQYFLRDNDGYMMSKADTIQTLYKILNFYDSLSEEDIQEYNRSVGQEHKEYYKRMQKEVEERQSKPKPGFMFIIKKVGEPLYKIKYGTERSKYDKTRSLENRLKNLRDEDPHPIELVKAYPLVNNPVAIHRKIMDRYGSTRDKFGFYILNAKNLQHIDEHIGKYEI